METFFSLPGGSGDDANNDTARNSSRRLDGAFLRATNKDLGEKKNYAFIVRGINATSFEIIRVVAPASSIGGQCRKRNVSRVAMRPNAFVNCCGDGDSSKSSERIKNGKETFKLTS